MGWPFTTEIIRDLPTGWGILRVVLGKIPTILMASEKRQRENGPGGSKQGAGQIGGGIWRHAWAVRSLICFAPGISASRDIQAAELPSALWSVNGRRTVPS